MKRVFTLTLVLAFLSVFGWAQGEKLSTAAQANVSVQRAQHIIPNEILVENYGLKVHPVLIVARHCQKYGNDLKACAADSTTEYFHELSHNIRTTAGGDWQASVMGNTSAPPATCNYIALSNDSASPAAGDTAVASEITTNGLQRAQGTYAHTNGTAVYTVSKTFSATGTQASQKTGLLNASSTGTLCFESTYTAVTVNSGDSLTVTWTINY